MNVLLNQDAFVFCISFASQEKNHLNTWLNALNCSMSLTHFYFMITPIYLRKWWPQKHSFQLKIESPNCWYFGDSTSQAFFFVDNLITNSLCLKITFPLHIFSLSVPGPYPGKCISIVTHSCVMCLRNNIVYCYSHGKRTGAKVEFKF